MYEKIPLEELPFKCELTSSMKEGLTIERLKGEFADFYYLTSSRLHRVYSFNGEVEFLITEISLFDLQYALNNDSFKNKVLDYLGN